jgi:pimeloyl-ACP methyl ester carboxylesterase
MRLLVTACVLAMTFASSSLATADPGPAFVASVSGHGRPIILIPGLGCPASTWDTTAKYLSQHYEVHTLALAGFAGLPPIDRAIPSATRDDVIRYIRDRHLDHPIVVGHSMGGFIALWIAETAPDLVGGVVVVDAGPTLGGGNPRLLPYAQAKVAKYKAMSDAHFTAAIRWRYSAMYTKPEEHAGVIAAVTRSDHDAFADALYELYTVDLRPKLSKITVPVLSIAADPRTAARLKVQMTPVKDHTLVELSTRHFVMADDFAGFTKAVDMFLTSHPVLPDGTRIAVNPAPPAPAAPQTLRPTTVHSAPTLAVPPASPWAARLDRGLATLEP